MYATIIEKWAINLKKREKGYMRGFGRLKGKGEKLQLITISKTNKRSGKKEDLKLGGRDVDRLEGVGNRYSRE